MDNPLSLIRNNPDKVKLCKNYSPSGKEICIEVPINSYKQKQNLLNFINNPVQPIDEPIRHL